MFLPSYRGLDARWFFTKEELEATPSLKAGLTSEKELAYRQHCASMIQDMGQKLSVNQLCISTAIVYMHRFYMIHSFSIFLKHSIAACSLFMAAKVEEQFRKVEHVVKVLYACQYKEKSQPIDINSELYQNMASELILNESFDITIDHPHSHVVKCCQLIRAPKDLAQVSYIMAMNSLHLTLLCLQYRASVIACVCIYIACKWSNWEIPKSTEGKEWFWYIDKDVTLEIIQTLMEEFMDIYAKSPHKLKMKLYKKEEMEKRTKEMLEEDKGKDFKGENNEQPRGEGEIDYDDDDDGQEPSSHNMAEFSCSHKFSSPQQQQQQLLPLDDVDYHSKKNSRGGIKGSITTTTQEKGILESDVLITTINSTSPLPTSSTSQAEEKTTKNSSSGILDVTEIDVTLASKPPPKKSMSDLINETRNELMNKYPSHQEFLISSTTTNNNNNNNSSNLAVAFEDSAAAATTTTTSITNTDVVSIMLTTTTTTTSQTKHNVTTLSLLSETYSRNNSISCPPPSTAPFYDISAQRSSPVSRSNYNTNTQQTRSKNSDMKFSKSGQNSPLPPRLSHLKGGDDKNNLSQLVSLPPPSTTTRNAENEDDLRDKLLFGSSEDEGEDTKVVEIPRDDFQRNHYSTTTTTPSHLLPKSHAATAVYQDHSHNKHKHHQTSSPGDDSSINPEDFYPEHKKKSKRKKEKRQHHNKHHKHNRDTENKNAMIGILPSSNSMFSHHTSITNTVLNITETSNSGNNYNLLRVLPNGSYESSNIDISSRLNELTAQLLPAAFHQIPYAGTDLSALALASNVTLNEIKPPPDPLSPLHSPPRPPTL